MLVAPLLALVLAPQAPTPAAAPRAEPAPGDDVRAPRGGELRPLQPLDVFDLEWATEPELHPDGERLVYVRNGFDRKEDRARTELWVIDVDGSGHRPLVVDGDPRSPRWSPDGTRLAYVARRGEETQIRSLWLDADVDAALARLDEGPGGLAWSPDGTRLAFTMAVEEPVEPLAELPSPPEGASWAEPPKVIERVSWRADGAGLLENAWRQVFVLPAEGGTPRQVTEGSFDHAAPAWTADGAALVVEANRRDDAELEPLDSELWRVDLATGALEALTDRRGPDGAPAVSPDGRLLAWLGFDDRRQGHQTTRLYVRPLEGSEPPRVLAADLDRDVSEPRWSPDGAALYVRYDDQGNGRVGRIGLDGRATVVATDVGGTSLGRPYGGGDFSVGPGGLVAYTRTRPDHPADVAVAGPDVDGQRRLTRLNADLLEHRDLAPVEEVWTRSPHDDLPVHAWIVRPPGFDPDERHPLLLEIHGGPFANYGDRFSAEVQLYAAAGYVVVYANPRGSTSYGEPFANAIHHAYPGDDYHDLMAAVDAALELAPIDPDRLYVTGGSGGGVLTAWIVGRTNRFRAAVVAKPVIDWTSFVLTADAYPFFARYWFPALPWEDPAHYWQRSPLSLVGEIETPTMLLTGDADLRTPISQSEELYQALQLRGIDTALVRIPGASHGIASRPSRLVAKVAHVLAWFDRHAPGVEEGEGDGDGDGGG